MNALTEALALDETAWAAAALCAQADPEAWFPAKGESSREVKKICRACPVLAECLAYALERDEQFGIWGGMSLKQRRRYKAMQSMGLAA